MKSTIIYLATIGSIITIGFGVWHFFVPGIWNWYSYIDPDATELILAIRAINVFFSLSLVSLGTATLVFIYFQAKNRFSLIVMLSVSSILWATRMILQIVYPQGSVSPLLQYSMLATFIFVFLTFILSLYLTIKNGQNS